VDETSAASLGSERIDQLDDVTECAMDSWQIVDGDRGLVGCHEAGRMSGQRSADSYDVTTTVVERRPGDRGDVHPSAHTMDVASFVVSSQRPRLLRVAVGGGEAQRDAERVRGRHALSVGAQGGSLQSKRQPRGRKDRRCLLGRSRQGDAFRTR
jgi:hypothetical protein